MVVDDCGLVEVRGAAALTGSHITLGIACFIDGRVVALFFDAVVVVDGAGSMHREPRWFELLRRRTILLMRINLLLPCWCISVLIWISWLLGKRPLIAVGSRVFTGLFKLFDGVITGSFCLFVGVIVEGSCLVGMAGLWLSIRMWLLLRIGWLWRRLADIAVG